MDNMREPTASARLRSQEASFSREDLQEIAARAKRLHSWTTSPTWSRAWQDLSQAASTLDAFMARSEAEESEERKKK